MSHPKPIRLDYTNVMSSAVGSHGLDEAELAALAVPSARALEAVLARRTKDLRWLDLPYQEGVRKAILDYARSVAGRFENVCVLGIGGSALGMRALHTALNGPFHDLVPQKGRPRLFVLDNIDPEWIGPFLEHVDPTKTVFNVISKSGNTAETMSQFLILREKLVQRLGEKAHKEHLLITTDEKKGVLRDIVEREGYRSFAVPEGVGGRFSVLSEVGLVPAALTGIDIEALHAGAREMDERCRTPVLNENPALLYAGLQFLLHTGRRLPMSVMFAYSHRLRDAADWYAQLLAESLGKKNSRQGTVVNRGPTPIRAVGVTDQHSQVQLYAEGPVDKWFTLLAVEKPAQDVTIPLAYEDLEGVAYLGKRKLSDLFDAEREGTRIALSEAGRPNAMIVLPEVNARTVGQLIYMLELSVAVMGEHYDVDAFDQPGVEAGKVAAYALMGRKGYEGRRKEIEAGKRTAQRHVGTLNVKPVVRETHRGRGYWEGYVFIADVVKDHEVPSREGVAALTATTLSYNVRVRWRSGEVELYEPYRIQYLAHPESMSTFDQVASDSVTTAEGFSDRMWLRFEGTPGQSAQIHVRACIGSKACLDTTLETITLGPESTPPPSSQG